MGRRASALHAGCLQRSSYINAFFITVLSPVAFILLMVFLKGIGLQSKHDVWRNSVYVLFMVSGNGIVLPFECCWFTRHLVCVALVSVSPNLQVYPSTCETIVNAFLCYDLPDGRRYLLEDFNVCTATASRWRAARPHAHRVSYT